MPLSTPSSFEAIAHSANDFAQEMIIHSATHPKANPLDESRRAAIYQGVRQVRTLTEKSSDTLLGNNRGNLFESLREEAKTIMKYSLGNCWEYTVLALYYIACHHPDVMAESMSIRNGDHVLLVIGRQSGSDESDPLTWGQDAIIADPWANTVYPASEYKTNLGAYAGTTACSHYGRCLTNRVVKFDPSWPNYHTISISSTFNTKK